MNLKINRSSSGSKTNTFIISCKVCYFMSFFFHCQLYVYFFLFLSSILNTLSFSCCRPILVLFRFRACTAIISNNSLFIIFFSVILLF